MTNTEAVASATTAPVSTGSPEPVGRRAVSYRRSWREVARRGLPFVLLVALVLYFGARSDVFLTTSNLSNLIRSGSILLIISLGMTFVIVQGGIDLSVGSIATMSGIATCYLLNDWEVGVWVFPLGALVGAAIGAFTGFLIAYLKIPSFLTTLGMLSVVAGIGDFVTNGSSQGFFDMRVSDMVRGNSVLGIPNLFWWAAGVFVLALFAQRWTTLGRYSYSIGGGELVTQMAGVPVARYKLYVFTVSGLTAGLGGVLLAARISGAGPGLGEPFMLQAITAITIGGTALTGGLGGVGRTLLGVILVTILANGMILTQVNAYTQEIVTGVVLIVAVALSLDRQRLQIFK